MDDREKIFEALDEAVTGKKELERLRVREKQSSWCLFSLILLIAILLIILVIMAKGI